MTDKFSAADVDIPGAPPPTAKPPAKKKTAAKPKRKDSGRPWIEMGCTVKDNCTTITMGMMCGAGCLVRTLTLSEKMQSESLTFLPDHTIREGKDTKGNSTGIGIFRTGF